MKKAIYIDLDGTLLNHNYQMSQEDEKFLRSIKDEWDIILSTGNSYRNSIEYYKKLKLKTFMSTSQGQVISNPITNENILNEIKWEHIKKAVNNKSIVNFLIETSKITYSKLNFGVLVSMVKNEYQIYAGEKPKEIISFYIEVPKSFELEIPNLDQYEWETRTTNKIITYKPATISKLSSMKEINLKNGYKFTIAIGDGRNDIDCLKHANIGIAMINSHPLVINEANMVSKYDNNNSGVSRVLIEAIKIFESQ